MSAPDGDAPSLCVIDSGIEEAHLWLAPAMHTVSSRCFLPGTAANAVHDEAPGAGHGTRVAGAVFYPDAVPQQGNITALAWIQNARVADATGYVPKALSPPRYLQDVVTHFTASEKATKLFNHSIACGTPCPTARMTA
ncbi:MAG: S8 family serine peptidase, partial [Opitutaceae bacterium]